MGRAEAFSRDPLQQILTCIGLYEEDMVALNAPYPGCLYASFIYETQLFDEETMNVARAVFASWTSRIAEKLHRVIELYPPPRPVSGDSLDGMRLVIPEDRKSTR